MQSPQKVVFEKAAKKMPVIGILRDIPQGEESACVQAAVSAGLTLLEVTMNTENAEVILSALRKAAMGTELVIGVGTVSLQKVCKIVFIYSPLIFQFVQLCGQSQNRYSIFHR